MSRRSDMRFTVRLRPGLGGSVTRAVEASRQALLDRVVREVRSRAHPNVAATVRRTPKGVVIDHPAANFIEHGARPHEPKRGPLVEWAISIGKGRRAAYAIARSIAARGVPAQPFYKPGIEAALGSAGRAMSSAMSRVFNLRGF